VKKEEEPFVPPFFSIDLVIFLQITGKSGAVLAE